jgi:protein-S-isoprenylcysteine O-methyltransferase Ste14
MPVRAHPPDNRIPPPLIAVLACVAMWAASRCWPWLQVDIPAARALAISAAVTGLLLNALPKPAFRHAATTVNPMRPADSSRLVANDLHAWSRNPMYLGHALIVLGSALWLAHAIAPLGLAAYLLHVTRFQVLPEERALGVRFGAACDAYHARVRRWL